MTTIPELSLSILRDLYAKQEQAKERYTVALNSTIAALGLDPREKHQLDIDTGIITPAAQDDEAK